MTKAERTRRTIIEQTASLFNKRGYAGTSLSDITQATGLTKGSIYGNFRDKDEVALAVYEFNTTLLARELKRAMGKCGNAYEKLEAFVRFYRENWKQVAASGGCPMMNAAVEADDTLPFLKKAVQRSFAGWMNTIEKVLKEGVQAGEFRKGIDPAAYSSTIAVLVEGGILLSKVYNSSAHLEIALNRVMQMVDTEIVA